MPSKNNKKYSDSDNNYSESDPLDKINKTKTKTDKTDKTAKTAKTIKDPDTNVKVVKNVENEENEEIQKRAKQTYIETDFLEKVIRYVKTDNLIRKESTEFKEKITTLKDEKQELENFIIRYLDIQDNNVININGSGKLTKYESVRKSGINKDIIQQSIYDQIKKEKVLTDETKIKELVDAMYVAMDGKREKKVKTVLKRTFIREKKEKPVKAVPAAPLPKVADETDDEKPKKIKKSKK